MPPVLSPLTFSYHFTVFMSTITCRSSTLEWGTWRASDGFVQWPLTPPMRLGPFAPGPDVLWTCVWTESLAYHVKPAGTALSSVLTALYSVLTTAFGKIPLSGLEKLLEIILKSMHLWGATVRRMAINHVELVGQERTSGKNRNTPKLSGFLISFSTIYIASHHSEKETWKLQLNHS